MKKVSIFVCLTLMFVFSNANATNSAIDNLGLIEFKKAQPVKLVDYEIPCEYEWQKPPKCTG